MKLTVEKVERSKTGKSWNVSANGGWYTSNAPGIEQCQGKAIDAEIGSFTLPDGKNRSTIQSFVVASGGQAAEYAAPSNGGNDRWWLPFVSNQTAHAIQCGIIKEARDIEAFARHAKLAILKVDAATDEIPF